MSLISKFDETQKLCKLNKLINEITDYKLINLNNEKQIRNIKDGISVNDILLYKFMYTEQRLTKEAITSHINYG